LDTVFQTLPKLKGLFISPTFSNVRYSFGSGFKNMSLTKLSVSESKICKCFLSSINNETFSNLPGLTHLYFAGCHVQDITPGALQPLNGTLEELDMSWNENLTFEGMNHALQGLENSTALQTLSVNYINILYEQSIELTKKDMRYISTMINLTNLYMDLNKIDVLEPEILTQQMFPPNLHRLTLAGNRLNYGKYTWYIGNPENLTGIDISRQFLGYDTFQFRGPEFASHQSFKGNVYQPNLMDSLMTNGNDMSHFVWDYAINAYGKHEYDNVSIRKFDWTELFNKNPDF